MKIRGALVFVTYVVATGAGSLQAQDPGPRPASSRALVEQGNLIGAVLEYADDLDLALTLEQRLSLEALRQEWDGRIRPHQEELRTLLGESERRPVPLQVIAPGFEALTNESRTAFRTAREEIFTPDQWIRVEAFLIGRVGGTL